MNTTMKILTCIALVLVSLIGCSSQTEPIPEKETSDQILKKYLVGYWFGTVHSVVYRVDNTCIDTFLVYSPYMRKWMPALITEGTYEIKNGVLSTTSFNPVYVDSAVSVSIRFDNYYLVITPYNILSRNRMNIFAPLQEYRPVLSGSWSSKALAYIKRSGEPAYVGLQNEICTFNSDSTAYMYEVRSVDGATTTSNIKFSLPGPGVIRRGAGGPFADVFLKFKYEQMWWLDGSTYVPFEKARVD